jgi:hypothetical protein
MEYFSRNIGTERESATRAYLLGSDLRSTAPGAAVSSG